MRRRTSSADLDDRAHMMVEGHAHALVGEVIGNLEVRRRPNAFQVPAPSIWGRVLRRPPTSLTMSPLVSANTMISAPHASVQREMLLERRDLRLGVTLQQLSRIPAADQAKPMPVEQRAQLTALLGHLATELDAAEAGCPRLGETGFDRV